MHSKYVVMQSWVGMAWAPARALQACIAAADVLALPTCRDLNFNNLSGTLPKEWSTMGNLSIL
jgi:hypothetical protein